jgi:hypothetical protein
MSGSVQHSIPFCGPRKVNGRLGRSNREISISSATNLWQEFQIVLLKNKEPDTLEAFGSVLSTEMSRHYFIRILFFVSTNSPAARPPFGGPVVGRGKCRWGQWRSIDPDKCRLLSGAARIWTRAGRGQCRSSARRNDLPVLAVVGIVEGGRDQFVNSDFLTDLESLVDSKTSEAEAMQTASSLISEKTKVLLQRNFSRT